MKIIALIVACLVLVAVPLVESRGGGAPLEMLITGLLAHMEIPTKMDFKVIGNLSFMPDGKDMGLNIPINLSNKMGSDS